VAVLVVGLRYSVVRVLFEHGRFGGASTDLTAAALAAYGPGIVAFSLDGLLVAAFYAMKDMKTPVLVGVVGVAADTALAWMLMQRLDHVGIAASISIVKTVKVAVLFGLLSRRLRMPAGGDVLRLLLGIAAASTVMVAVMLCVSIGGDGFFSTAGRFAELVRAGVVALAGSAAFAVVLWILGVAEVRQAAGRLTGRLRVRSCPAEAMAGERCV